MLARIHNVNKQLIICFVSSIARLNIGQYTYTHTSSLRLLVRLIQNLLIHRGTTITMFCKQYQKDWTCGHAEMQTHATPCQVTIYTHSSLVRLLVRLIQNLLIHGGTTIAMYCKQYCKTGHVDILRCRHMPPHVK